MNHPLFTILLTSHRKPGFVHAAIGSALAQTFTDYELMILDSGELLSELWCYDRPPRVTVRANGETPELCGQLAITPWIYNRFIAEARGQFIVYLCDDDLFLPDYLAAFAAAIEPGVYCYWTGMEMRQVTELGHPVKKFPDLLPGGTPARFRCNQMMMCCSHAAAREFPWPEEKATETFADGVLMERLAAKYPFKLVPGVHAIHQRTPLSCYGGRG